MDERFERIRRDHAGADSGLAAVHPIEAPDPETGAYERTAESGPAHRSGTLVIEPQVPDCKPERERMIARADSEEPPEDTEPRIERYRER